MAEEIKKIAIEDNNYPISLKNISSAPKTLYYQGVLPTEKEKCIAIVGSRNCSMYGKQNAINISNHLTEAGLTIVSGLAPGIDTFCHETTVELNKRTIAVLGTGLDEKSFYPKQNLILAKKILENGGCLISEYTPGTPGSKFTFPQRNRIISGLSLGVIAIEAKEKSGALITADYARKQSKKVFALPGPVHSSTSKGCHALIKKGAILIENANDVLRVLNFTRTKAKEITGENEKENLILKTLGKEALYIDKIITNTKLPSREVSSTLAILEIKGKVRNLGQNTWAIER